jgi:hypothetical protein
MASEARIRELERRARKGDEAAKRKQRNGCCGHSRTLTGKQGSSNGDSELTVAKGVQPLGLGSGGCFVSQ